MNSHVECLCTGESVEENANVVVRLLIRRPECFGPALRGEGGNGLLAAMEEAIKISEDPTRDGPSPIAEASRTLYVLATYVFLHLDSSMSFVYRQCHHWYFILFHSAQVICLSAGAMLWRTRRMTQSTWATPS